MMRHVALGVDVGGTKVAAGLVNSEGMLLYQTRVPIAASGTAEEGFAAVRQAVEQVLAHHAGSKSALAGIGIGSPGPLDPARGVIVAPRNLPCWRDYPLVAEVEAAFGLPTRLDNDANAAGLAEALWGAAAGHRNVFYVTVGTGIGTAIMLDQRIFHGRTGNAGEGGHVSIDYDGPLCNCGKRGCVEIFCSGPAIARRAQAKLAECAAQPSRMREIVAGSLDEIRAETVADAFRRGDPLASQVLEETADVFAVWLGNMIDLLDPGVIVVGGGVAEILSAFFDRIHERIPQCSINPRSAEVPLLVAKYGADAGIAGAAALLLSGATSPSTV
ncbi:MAG: ROK family protein [Candidatus Acidiferrales bacterium]